MGGIAAAIPLSIGFGHGTMILFELRCGEGHGFEAWFRSGDAYDAQVAAHEVACPLCGDTKVEKAPMAPRIAKGKGRKDGDEKADPALREKAREVMRELTELRRKVEENCDYVGDRFPDEARKMHYGEVEKRGIYGEATPEEAVELADEGVAFSRIPWVPRTNS
jgi:hypothetical protein